FSFHFFSLHPFHFISFHCIRFISFRFIAFVSFHFVSLHPFHCNRGTCKECNDATNHRLSLVAPWGRPRLSPFGRGFPWSGIIRGAACPARRLSRLLPS